MLTVENDGSSKADDISMIDTTIPIKKQASSMLALSPMKSQSQKTVEEGGVIADTFFGKLQSFIHYKDTQGEEKF